MNPLNLATATSSPPPVANDLLAKRKRGRPRKDETTTQPQQENVNLVGKTIYGEVEGTFDAGYILKVKVKDSDTKLTGLVFLPGRGTPVTPENDVAPNVKMFAKEGEAKNETDLPPDDQPMNDVEITGSAGALVVHQSNGEEEEPKEAEKDGAMEEGEAASRLVDFFPAAETMMVTRGFEVKEAVVGSVEKEPQELKLELGNKTTVSGGDNNVETDPKTSVVSKSGFLSKLFEGEDKKVDSDMEEEAAASSV